MTNTVFHPTALEDLARWAKTDPKLVKKVFELLDDIHKHPFEGLGKPEPLKHQFKGYWSRRITDEHRLIYRVLSSGEIYLLSAFGHYDS
jgi:toxin YoeB